MSDNEQIDDIKIPEIDSSITKAIDELSTVYEKFKYNIYKEIVQSDLEHDAQDLGALFDYHGIILQTIGYWISVLDHEYLVQPEFPTEELQDEFEAITNRIYKLQMIGADSRTLTYNLLFKKSVEHPFRFFNNNTSEDV
jgi:hypothetical protein